MRTRVLTVVALYAGSSLLVVLLYALGSGITCTNDGSHFALADSLIERSSFVLDDNARLAGHDIAEYRGRTFAGRDPGLALLALAVYRVAAPLHRWQAPLVLDPYTLKTATPEERARLPLLMLIPCLCGGLLPVGLYLLLRELGTARGTALPLALLLVPGTLLLRYGTVFYVHILTAVLVTFAWVCCVRAARRLPGRDSRRYLAAGSLLLAWAVVGEPLAVLLYVPLLAYLLTGDRPLLADRPHLAAFVLGGLGPAVLLAALNTAYFGNPLFGAYFHHATYDYNRSLSTAFAASAARSGPWAWRLLAGPAPFTSVLGASPILLLAPAALVLFAVRRRTWTREHAWLLSSFAVVLVATSMYREPFAGYDQDYRYMLFVLPALLPFVAETVAWFTGAVRTSLSKAGGLGVALVLLGVSVVRQLEHVRHPLQPGLGRRLVNLQAAVHNTLPILATGAVVMALLLWRQSRARAVPRPEDGPGTVR